MQPLSLSEWHSFTIFPGRLGEIIYRKYSLSSMMLKKRLRALYYFFQKNVIELLLEKYFRSGKLIIRALFLQLTSGVDLFFTIVNLTKCIHITAMFLQMELILANAVLQNLNRNISHTCTRKTDNPTSITRYGGQFWFSDYCLGVFKNDLCYSIQLYTLCWISIVVQTPYKYFS